MSHVIAPNEQGGWVEMRQKEDIERACLDELQQKFRQASDTPFLQPPLLDWLGPIGADDNADSVLDGTFTLPDDAGIDPYAVCLLHQ